MYGKKAMKRKKRNQETLKRSSYVNRILRETVMEKTYEIPKNLIRSFLIFLICSERPDSTSDIFLRIGKKALFVINIFELLKNSIPVMSII